MRGRTQTLGYSSLEGGDPLSLVFSHDISNHQVMVDEEDSPIPRSLAPRMITIETQRGSGAWQVQPGKGEYP